MRLQTRLHIVWLIVCSAGCTRPNPAYCTDSSDCMNGTFCDTQTHACTAVLPDASTSCATSAECMDLSLPVCGEDQSCRACLLDDECASRVCRSDGACEPEADVLYVSPSGLAAGQCTNATPCELFYARSQLTTARTSIRLENGIYSLVSAFAVAPPLDIVTIVGGRGAVIQRSSAGPAADVRGGSRLVLRGVTLSRGVDCMAATLEITRVLFDSPLETRAWILLSDCMATVVEAELLNSSEQGIDATGGTLEVTATVIARSAGHGIRASVSSLKVLQTSIEQSGGMGISSTSIQTSVSRSTISENHLGGISSVGGNFDITNNFVFRNGDDPDADFGGLRLESAFNGNRVDHNTIVRNDCRADTVLAGGMFCSGGGSALNNLITNNFAGNNSLPAAQYVGSCTLSGSLVANDDTGFRFVRPISVPFDYHLADNLSDAFDAGMVTPQPIAVDYDGDQRSDGKPDVGADELLP